MGTVLWLSIVWIAPLICFLQVNEARFKKNIVVGVTLPFKAREDEAVKTVLKKYKMSMWTACGILMALAAAGWALAPESMTLWLVWVDLCIILPYVPYVRTNSALKKLKIERGWDLLQDSRFAWTSPQFHRESGFLHGPSCRRQ